MSSVLLLIAIGVYFRIDSLNNKITDLSIDIERKSNQIAELENSLKLERARAYIENVILTDNKEKITEIVFVTKQIEIEVEREVRKEIDKTPKDVYNSNVAKLVLDSMWKQYHCATGVHSDCTSSDALK